MDISDEEKKAIDYLQLCYDLSTIDNESLPKLATILNLIEKQDKIVDLMVEYIVDLIKYNNPEEKREIQEVKEYFRKKVENEK